MAGAWVETVGVVRSSPVPPAEKVSSVKSTEPWGVNVTIVEVKDVELPPDMQRAMARQAEAERDRRAKIINAEASSRRPSGWPRPDAC